MHVRYYKAKKLIKANIHFGKYYFSFLCFRFVSLYTERIKFSIFFFNFLYCCCFEKYCNAANHTIGVSIGTLTASI